MRLTVPNVDALSMEIGMITTNEIHSTFKGQSSDDVGAEDYGPCMHGVICSVMRFNRQLQPPLPPPPLLN